MLLGSKQKLSALDIPPSLKFDSDSLKQVKFTKSFGVYIDENLS